ncbi:MAG TPA: hypothetical protein VFU31_13245 [Candidatus Binatia bacterium]|nr:hypothetical protein [Candidatus Binatia bacterium]
METLYAWLVLLAGATAGVLGMLLLSSERELKSIRREVEKVRNRQTTDAMDRSPQTDRAETDSSVELMTRNKQLAEEIYSLSSRLEESQKTVDELQNQQQRSAHAQSENQELQRENRRLQQELAELKNRLESTNALLGTSGSQYDDLAERHFQLQSELAQLSQQIDKLTAKNNEQREQIDSLSNKLAASERRIEDLQLPQPEDSQQARPTEMQPGLSAGEEKVQHNGNAIHPGSNDLGAGIEAANEETIQPAVRTLAKQRWSIGIVTAAIGVVAVAGGLAVSLLDTNSDDSFVSKEPAAAFETVWHQPPAETARKTSKRTGAGSMAASENEFANQKPGRHPAPRLQGAFKTTRPTEVYSRPSKNSSLIANIGPGMKLNVVDSHDGWLEIRSKHGRPPGFVREEAAVRID